MPHTIRVRRPAAAGGLVAATEQLRRAVDLVDIVSEYHLWYGKAMTKQVMRIGEPDARRARQAAARACSRTRRLDPPNDEARKVLK